MRNSLIAIMVAVTSGNAVAQELTQRLESPIKQTLTSSRPAYDLELCIADAITQRGGAKPTVIRDGEHDVIVFGYESSPTIAVSLKRTEGGTRLEIRTRGSDMDNRLTAGIRERCGTKINP